MTIRDWATEHRNDWQDVLDNIAFTWNHPEVLTSSSSTAEIVDFKILRGTDFSTLFSLSNRSIRIHEHSIEIDPDEDAFPVSLNLVIGVITRIATYILSSIILAVSISTVEGCVLTKDDIQETIGNKLLSLRHVSSKEIQDEELSNGTCGCALNLAFCKSEDSQYKAKFEGLHNRNPLRDEDVEAYEQAILTFIKNSLAMDSVGADSPQALFDTIMGKSCFTLMGQTYPMTADACDYKGLGRQPNMYTSSDRLAKVETESLRALRPQNGTTRFQSTEQRNILLHKIAQGILTSMIEMLREGRGPATIDQMA